MEFFIVLMSLLGIVFLVRIFTRYDPKFDLVKSGNKYILFFWYNKYSWADEYEGRAYIKLFEL